MGSRGVIVPLRGQAAAQGARDIFEKKKFFFPSDTMLRPTVTFCALVLFLFSQVSAIKWLAVSQVSAIASSSRDPEVCDQMKGSLIKKQVKFCKRNPGFMDSVRLGAVRAIDECQYQFRSRRWNCSSLQDNVNKHVNLIRAHLGTKMSESDLAGVKMGGLPALPSSSVYSQQSRMYDPEPTINAMFNSYNTYRDKGKGREGRNSRNVRRGQRLSRSRKARRGIETQMMEKLPEVTNDKVNGTKKVDITKNNKSNKEKNRKERKKKKDPLAEWQAALGPYPVVSPGPREASFVHTISSAGVAHAVTRSCSSGELENCGCDRSLRGMSPEGFQWSGC